MYLIAILALILVMGLAVILAVMALNYEEKSYRNEKDVTAYQNAFIKATGREVKLREKLKFYETYVPLSVRTKYREEG